jgi:Flp pilus assembly protein TadG
MSRNYHRPSRRTGLLASLLGKAMGAFRNEKGVSVIETALALPVVFALLFAGFEFTMMLYAHEFVSDASREATRYAMVRGSTSCTNTPSLSNCGLNPSTTGNPIQTYVQSLGFPMSSDLTATATWLTATTAGTPGTTTWSTCASGTCNLPGNAVKVTVTCAFPVSFPFWRNFNFNISSTSQMVISQ